MARVRTLLQIRSGTAAIIAVMTVDWNGSTVSFRRATSGCADDVLRVLNEAAAWLNKRGISQWPSRFEAEGLRRRYPVATHGSCMLRAGRQGPPRWTGPIRCGRTLVAQRHISIGWRCAAGRLDWVPLS
jgi:hypothetical protein